MRRSESEKLETIRLVEQSELSVTSTFSGYPFDSKMTQSSRGWLRSRAARSLHFRSNVPRSLDASTAAIWMSSSRFMERGAFMVDLRTSLS